MASVRTLFGKHREGYIFPMLMKASPMDNCFMSVMQRLTTSDEYIWFFSKSFTVCAASHESMRLLGVSGRCQGLLGCICSFGDGRGG